MRGGSKPNFEPAPSATRPEPRFRSLDGLRGAAALMVALCHFLTAFQSSIMDGNPATAHFAAAPALSHIPLILLYNPELCVSIFFILSGFVLAFSVVESGAPLHAVIARRWVRLALPVMAAFIFAFAIPALGLNFSQPAAVWSKSNWLALQYTGITLSLSEFARGLAESAIVLMYMSYGWHTLTLVLVSPADGWGNLVRHYNFNLWTMPIEFAGSIALFIFYRIFLLPLPWKLLVRLTAVAAILAYLWKTPFFGFPAGMALFECYRLAGAVRFPRSGQVGAIAPAAMAFVIGGLLFVSGLVLGGCPFELNMSAGAFYKTIALALWPFTAPISSITVMHETAAFCLVAAAIWFVPFRVVLASRLFQFLGRISFMVYLLQLPVLCFVGAGAVVLLAPHIGYNMATILAAGAFIAATLAAATLLTHLVDIPAIRASRRLASALS